MRTPCLALLVAVFSPTVAFAQIGAANNPIPTSASPGSTTLSMPERHPAQTGDALLDQVTCKEQPPPTGTRVGGLRVCKTQREWIQDEDAMNRNRNLQQQVQQTVQSNMAHGMPNPGH